MTLSLHTLKPKKGSRRSKKRVGRGLASTGTYSGRGVKGQRARSGGRRGLKLKGIRPLMLATPKKRGFIVSKPKPAIVNIGDVAKAFAGGAQVNPKTLMKRGLIENMTYGVKILAKGEIAIPLSVSGCLMSASAKEKIEKAGGAVIIEEK